MTSAWMGELVVVGSALTRKTPYETRRTKKLLPLLAVENFLSSGMHAAREDHRQKLSNTFIFSSDSALRHVLRPAGTLPDPPPPGFAQSSEAYVVAFDETARYFTASLASPSPARQTPMLLSVAAAAISPASTAGMGTAEPRVGEGLVPPSATGRSPPPGAAAGVPVSGVSCRSERRCWRSFWRRVSASRKQRRLRAVRLQ